MSIHFIDILGDITNITLLENKLLCYITINHLLLLSIIYAHKNIKCLIALSNNKF